MKPDLKMCAIESDAWKSEKGEIRDRVRDATHLCTKCFRVSNNEKILCRAKKIK